MTGGVKREKDETRFKEMGWPHQKFWLILPGQMKADRLETNDGPPTKRKERKKDPDGRSGII